MSTLEDPVADVELGQQKRRQRRRRRRQRQTIAGGSESTTDGSRYFSDSEDDHPSWQSSCGSAVGGSPQTQAEECRVPEMERSAASRRRRKIGKEKTGSTEVDDVDLEKGDLELEMKVHVSKKKRVKKECRICHVRLVEKGEESDVGIDLGCFCKGDLGACHRKCAETWFKIKGNTICEICGAIAMNVVIEQPVINEAVVINMSAAAAVGGLAPTVAGNVDLSSDAQNCWHGRRVMNSVLTCLVLALIISWLFHFNMGSKN